jgi:ABC-type lipoprotein release transport system permease subunit
LIIDRKAAFIGLMLCSILFAVSVPLLVGIGEIPEKAFGQDVVTLSQVSSADPLKADIAYGLKGVPGVGAASPEIYSFCAVGQEPVFVRGVLVEEYLKIENGTLSPGSLNETWRFAVAGSRLAKRMGIGIGDKIVLTGSVVPKIVEMDITGIYSSPDGGGNDLLVPLWVAGGLSGIGEGMVHAIRVQASNLTAISAFLEGTEERLVISQGGGVSTPINTNTSASGTETQLALRYLDSATFKASNGSYVSLFVQEGTENVNVVVGGFIALEGTLTFVGSVAVMNRVLAHRHREIGILSAIGATRWKILGMTLYEALPVAVSASIIGVTIGSALAVAIDQFGLLVMFGQSVVPVFTLQIIIIMIASMVSISLGAASASAWAHASARPERTMHESGEEAVQQKALDLRRSLEAED